MGSGVMSKHGSSKIVKVSQAVISKIEKDPLFRARMAKIKSTPVIRKYDIPYLAGYSNDASKIYIDRHLDTKMSGIDLTQFLKIHETIEKCLLDEYGMKYQQAHHIATHFEMEAVKKAGISWKKYDDYLRPYIKRVHVEHLSSVPADLDVEPYKDEHEKKLLRSLMKTEKKNVREALGLTETKISLEYHDELNTRLWDGWQLKPEVRDALLKFAKEWGAFAKIPMDTVTDIIMIGGNCNYNYTSKSDIDVHLVLDRNKISTDRALVDEYLQSKKHLWTLTHNVSVYGYPLEPYAQDSHQAHQRGQGVYSLKRDSWIQRPERGEFKWQDDPNLKRKVMYYVKTVDNMIKSKMGETAFKEMKKKLADMRSAGISKHGEFSFENLVFKELRNRGVLDKMNKYEKTLKDRSLSLK
jgi:hypothetical protein